MAPTCPLQCLWAIRLSPDTYGSASSSSVQKKTNLAILDSGRKQIKFWQGLISDQLHSNQNVSFAPTSGTQVSRDVGPLAKRPISIHFPYVHLIQVYLK